jgi:hypothetical protein
MESQKKLSYMINAISYQVIFVFCFNTYAAVVAYDFDFDCDCSFYIKKIVLNMFGILFYLF